MVHGPVYRRCGCRDQGSRAAGAEYHARFSGIRQNGGMGDAVLYDGWCGEPVAWARIGQPVIGHEWTERGQVSVTEWLTPTEAIRKYGPVTEVQVGRNGGFRSVTYGAKKFLSRCVDPRGTGVYDSSVVVVDDPARANYECPVCGAAPGEQCVSTGKKQPCATHGKRSQGRSRWQIEKAEEEARKAREEAEAAEQWQRDMATPPVIGAVLDIKRWTMPAAPPWDPWVTERAAVERTYANRTVQVMTEAGERETVARNEYTGDWLVLCGQPTSARLPCRNGRDCRTKHKTGLQLREDAPWI